MPLFSPPIIIQADIRKPNNIKKPVVTQNDSVVLQIEVFENKNPFDLTGAVTVSLASVRKDGVVVTTPGSAVGNVATFNLGTNEVAVTGEVRAKAQFYDADGRVSTLSFSYLVEQDPTGSGFIPSVDEETLIEFVMNNAQQKIDELSAVDVVDLTAQMAETAKFMTNVLTVFVDSVNGNDTTGNGMQSTPYKTISKAWDSIPMNATKEVVIQLTAGTYNTQGGTDEWGRPTLVSFHEKFINAKRDSNKAIDTKGSKITIKGEGKTLTTLDGSVIGARAGIYGHNVKNIYLDKLKIIGCTNGILAHEGGDITCLDIEVSGNVNGLSIESQARIEIGWSSIKNNDYNVYIKNGQLQMNNSNVDDANINNFKVEGGGYIITDAVTSKTLASKTCIDAKGVGYWDMKVCDFEGTTGSIFMNGTIQHFQISQGTHLHGFGSNVFAPKGGFIHCTSSHIWGNGFVVFATEGNPYIKMDNCDSKNKSGIDEPNTQATPIRMNCAGTMHITGTTVLPYKTLYAPPSDAPILFGSAPPTTGYHFKGKIMINTGATVSGNAEVWKCDVAGVPGTWITLVTKP